MASKKLLVNLDAMIGRADFAQTSNNTIAYENVSSISVRDFTKEGLLGNNLRKPDFQRETNHWEPEQVVSLIDCFLNGELIPSVIMWQSDTFIYVIDGGHRLSAIKAWIEDDYGDGPISIKFFGDAISDNQREAAEKTRKKIAEAVGSYQHYRTKIDHSQLDNRTRAVMSRGINIQWVIGDADKAENSFFKINTQGTPLDYLEESLLRYRKCPIAISSRAVIRAGKGHKYWSTFDALTQKSIEEFAKNLHSTLFDPEIKSPIKTLDLPLGGSKGVRQALQVLIEYISIANYTQTDKTVKIDFGGNDEDGTQTVKILKNANKLANKITGNANGSLGLHPAVYFYGPSGAHSVPMFLGTAMLIGEKLLNNDENFFKHFTTNREKIEKVLIDHKDLIATILQKLGSKNRVKGYYTIISSIYKELKSQLNITVEKLIEWGGVTGKIIVGFENTYSKTFSDEVKSQTFITTALKTAMTCPLCNGYLDPQKSVSYDHIKRKQDGGKGHGENCQITHPYCNQGLKN